MTARAFWPSEPELNKGAGRGLSWVLAVFVVCGLALAAGLIGGRFRFRWSWTDALVIGLMTLVARSAWHAVDRRPAINMAWEWIALGLAYLLVRNLPRTRNESSTLAGVLVATAFAVSCYGLYQNGVELPMLQAAFQRNPQQFLRALDIEPGSRGEEMLRNRLLFSNELFSTFALPNSLAGFIVGPLALALAVSLRNLVRRDGPGSRWSALAMAAPVILVLLVSLILTKSRSAWVGLLVAMIYWAWHARRHLSVRVLVATGMCGLAVVTALVLAGLATGRLDREVVTQSTMSLRYRWEYWQGAWGVISGGATDLMTILRSPILWWGVGPGNFGGHYLKYKLPEASEEIQDPHNLFLEVWSTAGVWAVVALIGALGWGLWNLFGRSARDDENDRASRADRGRRRDSRRESAVESAAGPEQDQELDSAPNRTTWLVGFAGVGGWALVALLGELNPFESQMAERWLILGMSWLVGVILGAPLWRRLPISADALGAAVVAVVINLLAAGGIGYPTVALGLWLLLALGLNLRDDRSCGRLRQYESRVPPFVVAVVWAAILGTFVGTIAPFWRSEAAIARAQAAVSHRPPEVERADQEYEVAIAADRYFARPWRELANLHFLVWQERGAAVDDRDTRWSMKTIPFLYQMVVTPPRNPDSWTMHDERARVIHQMLKVAGSKLQPLELMKLRGELIKSTRIASLLYPTKIELHARLAEASAEIGMYQDAVDEAREALRLDRITPHRDKKLPGPIRDRLEAEIPTWSENAARNPLQRTP